ncbi:hypothetical protein BAU15_05640 [Enterococcus sp. JM4C]|uniref:patatin-like phospholipase family protein n=1 Tax=Candidatus Enterococcus huntleyi TaxID=1857217 RepID=UPI00137ACD4B|nr:patatin-like phospholipase family protein [Enterococcus sp. JM4C]KAF1295231.1 hypothetical protein BAU15_05640 [Enterococcus sp. JM4C]
MLCQKVYPSEVKGLIQALQRSQLSWPFYDQHSIARKEFLKSVKKGYAWQVSEQGKILGFLSFAERQPGKPVILTNALFLNRQLGWKKSLSLLEKVAKERFCSAVQLQFTGGTGQLEFLLEQGYHYNQEENQFTKQLIYNTALVLGGGGAHGSYQIGVWQALKELGISFNIVTGTSVGALNGAFVLQGDSEVAKEMWESLSTDAVMSFPAAANTNQTLRELLLQIASLTTTAIRNRGVSTQPLRQLLESHIQLDKIEESPLRLFIVTTEMSGLKETVVEINTAKSDQLVDWLLASASFFPAMQAIEIEGLSYMDGGYRNNLSIDVALREGATECIAVDVKGPGITKRMRLSEETVSILLHSPWELGTFLVFDAVRSRQNLQLGYLETQKKFGQLKGYWYTFDLAEDTETIWHDFWQEIRERPYLKEYISQDAWLEKIILPRLRKLYKDRVTLETIGLAFIELVAKTFQLLPTKVYTINQLRKEIKVKKQQPANAELGVLSVQEWLDRFREESFVFSEKNQLLYLKKRLIDELDKSEIDKIPEVVVKSETELQETHELASGEQGAVDRPQPDREQWQSLQRAVQKNPVQVLLVLFIDYLMEGSTW